MKLEKLEGLVQHHSKGIESTLDNLSLILLKEFLTNLVVRPGKTYLFQQQNLQANEILN
jgi:hypothetical protein